MNKFLHTVFSASVGLTLAFGSLSCGGGSSSSSDSGGGGGGGTDVAGLEIARQMSLVEAADGASASHSALRTRIHHLAALTEPTTGDYTTDEPEIWTYDRSMEFLDEINAILCYMNGTEYSSFVNQGEYIALVNVGDCEKDHSGDSSNQSNAESVELEKWIVNATRESDTSDEIVEFWVDLIESEGVVIKGKLTITEGESADNPFGIFRMDATETNEDGTETLFEFTLQSSLTDVGDIDLQMIMDGSEGDGATGSGTFTMAVHANFLAASNNQEGVAHIEKSFTGEFDGETFSEEDIIDVAFNTSRYLANYDLDGGTESDCRDRENFNNHVFQYNLYNPTTGDRVDLNAGMGVRFDTEDGQTEYGWANQWGVWGPPHIDITSGLEVTDDSGDATYTVFQAPVRIMRHERNTTTLGDLTGKSFRMWDENTGSSFVVEWNGTDLVSTGAEVCGENGCQVEETDETPLEFEPFEWVNLWAEDFGSAGFVYPELGLSDDFEIIYYTNEQVMPRDTELFASGDAVFGCYEFCPKAGLTADEWNAGQIAFESQGDVASPYLYTIDSDTLAVTYDGTAIGLAETLAEDENFGPNAWGFNSGNMLVAADLAALENTWEMYSQDVSYTIETGPNDWNKTTLLLDSNNSPVVFDDPLRCEFTHPSFGKAFLNYEGAGNLWGIPWVKAESDEDSGFEYWAPLYSLEDGQELDCGGTTYVTKAMAMEQAMQQLDPSECSDLVTGNIDEVTIEYSSENTDIGDIPTVTTPPAVIDGVIQE